MDARPDISTYDVKLVASRLEEAGKTLLALPLGRTGPASYRAFWPELDVAEREFRAPPPSARHITRMDQALTWISLIPDSDLRLRRVVSARCLISPLTDKPIFSWRHIAELLGCSDKTVKGWWTTGICIITDRLNRPGLCQQDAFHGTRLATMRALETAARQRRRVRELEEA